MRIIYNFTLLYASQLKISVSGIDKYEEKKRRKDARNKQRRIFRGLIIKETND